MIICLIIWALAVVTNEENYALDFEKWNNIKNLPIKLNHVGKINIFRDDIEKIEIESIFTVSDFFNALFGEICFFGTPEERKNQLNKLEDTIDGIENGTIKTYPWKDIKDKIGE